MPITPFLNGQKFDAETRRVLGVAFELVCVALRTEDGDDDVKQCIASQIIELASDGECNPDVLCERALELIRGSASRQRAFNGRSRKRMARVPVDVKALLEMHRSHVLTSAERMSKSVELYAQVQARIEASMALIERVSALKRADGVGSKRGVAILGAKQHI